MKQLVAFTKKEFMEYTRTGKVIILTLLFVIFGIMNPALAKMTPWLMEMMSGELAEAGLAVAEVKVDALTSWTQFYKNIPFVMVIALILFSGNMAAEYQRGTLVNMVTKGLSRWKIIASKAILMIVFWTAGYWVGYGITFGYNAYYWDNKIASNLLFSAACYYLMGLWLVSAVVLMSTFLKANTAVIIMTGGVYLVTYLLSFLPKLKEYMPEQLSVSAELLYNRAEQADYLPALIVTVVLFVINIVAAIISFNKSNII